MAWPILTAPPSPALLAALPGKALVLRLDAWERLPQLLDAAAAGGNQVAGLLLDYPSPDAIGSPPPCSLPLLLRVGAFGRFRDWVEPLPWLRQSDAVISLAADRPDNLVGLRQLASLGLRTHVDFVDCGAVDWEGLGDLMAYSLYGRCNHRPIEPFAGLHHGYQPDRLAGWGPAFLDDPAECLHLDEAGRIACSRRDLREGRLLGGSVFELEDPAQDPVYVAARRGWERHFLAADDCSRCPGWRLCVGRVADHGKAGPECRALFTELADAIDEIRRACRVEC